MSLIVVDFDGSSRMKTHAMGFGGSFLGVVHRGSLFASIMCSSEMKSTGVRSVDLYVNFLARVMR
jgi:hypothetical protein